MTNKQRSLTNYTYSVNIAQLCLCFIVFLLRSYSVFDNQYVLISVNVIELLIWFCFGIMFSLGLNIRKASKSFIFAFFSVLPISIVTGAATILGYFFTTQTSVSWASFFFIGSAVNFFNKPCVFMASFLPENAFIVYWANIAAMFLFSLIGSFIGTFSNNSSAKKRAKKLIEKQNTNSVKANVETEAKTQSERAARDKRKQLKEEKAQRKVDKELIKQKKREKLNPLKDSESPNLLSEKTSSAPDLNNENSLDIANTDYDEIAPQFEFEKVTIKDSNEKTTLSKTVSEETKPDNE